MKERYMISLALNAADLATVKALRKDGWKLIDIFRRGLESARTKKVVFTIRKAKTK